MAYLVFGIEPPTQEQLKTAVETAQFDFISISFPIKASTTSNGWMQHKFSRDDRNLGYKTGKSFERLIEEFCDAAKKV